jgi:hypothetical protein
MRIAVSLLAVLVLVAGASPVAALAAPSPAAPTGAPASPTAAGPPSAGVEAGPSLPAVDSTALNRIDPPTVTEIYIEPDPGGDARWNVSFRYRLPTASDRAAFRTFGRAYERGDADPGTGLDADFFRTLADAASEQTGRDMSIRDASRNATVRNETGVVSLSFTWTNFVTDTESGFVVREAVLMPGDRSWLSSIGPTQRLVIETPSGYRVSDTRFGLENGSVVVEGPHTFEEPLTVAYQRTAIGNGGGDDSPPWSLLAVLFVLGVGVLAAVVYVRRRDGAAEAPAEAPDRGPSPGGGDPTPEGAGDGAETGSEGDDADAAAESGDGDADAESEGGDEDADDEVDLSLLSDEERVEHLLERNGGRMKQARIVSETGWSDAKVSQLLSSMADEGRVEKLRLGRENIISLPDEEP